MLNQWISLTTPVARRDQGFVASRELGLLPLHYLEFLEAADDRLFCAIVDDWIEHNLAYQPRYWSHNWNCCGLSIHTVILMQQAAQRNDRHDPAFADHVHRSVFTQLVFLLGLFANHVSNHR
ncbi:MAG: hypothetical protein GY944_11800 [bacterium]|nr:hypothetical protein [bacterium]